MGSMGRAGWNLIESSRVRGARCVEGGGEGLPQPDVTRVWCGGRGEATRRAGPSPPSAQGRPAPAAAGRPESCWTRRPRRADAAPPCPPACLSPSTAASSTALRPPAPPPAEQGMGRSPTAPGTGAGHMPEEKLTGQGVPSLSSVQT